MYFLKKYNQMKLINNTMIESFFYPNEMFSTWENIDSSEGGSSPPPFKELTP